MHGEGARPTQLVRVLGVGFGLAATVGGMVGQGILRVPGIVAGAIPDPALNIGLWIGIGLFCLLDACGTVEMAASVPRAGGPYAFVARAYGPVWSAMVGWADVLNNVASIGFLSFVSAEYLQRLSIGAALPTGRLAVIIVLLFTALNWTGTRLGGMSQGVGSALKGAGLIFMVAILFASPGHGQTAPAAADPALTIGALAIAARAIKNTYDGWNTAAYFCEEVQAPERNLPRSIFGGILLVTILYTTVNVALLHVLTPAQLANSTLPAADAMRASMGPYADLIVSGLATLSVLAITNLFIMFGARITFAMARQGVLPGALTATSRTGVPRVAMVTLVVPGIVLAWTGSYDTLVAFGISVAIVANVAVSLAALRMRRIAPDLPRPFKTPFYPWPIVISLAINGVLLAAVLYEDPFHSGIGLVGVALAGVAHRIAAGPMARPVPQS